MKAPFGDILMAVGFLHEGDDIVDGGGIKDLERPAEIEPEQPDVLQKPCLYFLGVFGMAKGVGNDERGIAAGAQEFYGAFNEGDVDIPFFPKGLILFVGQNGFALAAIPIALLVGADIGRVADNGVETNEISPVIKDIGKFKAPFESAFVSFAFFILPNVRGEFFVLGSELV